MTSDLSDLGIVPWTRREFQRELRRAGWRRMSGPAAVYRSPDDRDWLFHMDDYRARRGVLWRYYAVRRQLPATTRPPF